MNVEQFVNEARISECEVADVATGFSGCHQLD